MGQFEGFFGDLGPDLVRSYFWFTHQAQLEDMRAIAIISHHHQGPRLLIPARCGDRHRLYLVLMQAQDGLRGQLNLVNNHQIWLIGADYQQLL